VCIFRFSLCLCLPIRAYGSPTWGGIVAFEVGFANLCFLSVNCVLRSPHLLALVATYRHRGRHRNVRSTIFPCEVIGSPCHGLSVFFTRRCGYHFSNQSFLHQRSYGVLTAAGPCHRSPSTRRPACRERGEGACPDQTGRRWPMVS
jgi:hypothetical protein